MKTFKKDISKFFLNKKNVILSLGFASSIIATPILATISSYVFVHRDITIFGEKFSSQSEIVDYIKKNSEKIEYIDNQKNGSYWSFTYNGKNYQFDDVKDMYAKIAEISDLSVKIDTYVTSRSDEELSKFLDPQTGQIVGKGFFNELDLSSSIQTANKTKIYQSFDDKVNFTEEEAFKSYYQEKDAYYFNGLYFESKADLLKYLKEYYLVDNQQQFNDIIVIKSPNGTKSAPINLSDKESALEIIKSFIENNSYSVVSYTGSDGTYKEITNQNIQSVLNDINFTDLDYTHVYSNQGEASYYIDNSIEDEHNLMGPVFYQGALDVGSFKNKAMWKKTTEVNKFVYEESMINNFIGQFFSSIINDDNALNLQESLAENKIPVIFRTLMAGNLPDMSLDEEYLYELNRLSPDTYLEVTTALINMLNAKKFNTFFKFPIMYSMIMQKLISVGAKKEIINLTREYFGKVADYIQAGIEIILMDESLLYNSKNEKFNLRKLFQIDSKDYDFNTDPQYFIEEIKKFPQMVVGMISYIEALNNVSMLGGLVPYDSNNHNFLFDFGLINQEEYLANKHKFVKIYNVFSTLNYQSFVNEFVQNSNLPAIVAIRNNPSIKPEQYESELDKIEFFDGIILGTYLKTVIAKNTIEYDIASSALESEMQEYYNNHTIVAGGMLSQLGPAVNHFLIAYDVLKDQYSAYQVYLSLLTDMRTGGSTLTYESTYADPLKITQAFSLFLGVTLGTFGALADIINNLYWQSCNLFWNGKELVDLSPEGKKTFFTPLKEAMKNTYDKLGKATDKLKEKFSRKNGSYRLTPKTYSPVSISAGKFFLGLDKVVSVFSKAAPILGAGFFIFQAALLIWELFREERIQTYYIYTTADGTEFVWDGGLIISKYLGLSVEEVTTIDAMKLIDPIRYNLPVVEEFYYYDGIKYFDRADLKWAQLKYILSPDYNNENPNFKKRWSFTNYSIPSEITAYDTKEELFNAVLKDIGITLSPDGTTIESTSINVDSIFLENASFSFNTGIIDSYEGSINAIATKIVDNIRPTKYAKLPTTTNGYADPFKTDRSTVIPGKVWTRNGIIDNSSMANQYVIDDSANRLIKPITDWTEVDSSYFETPNQAEASKKASYEIYNNFKSRFNVRTKDVLSSDITNGNINTNNSYSSLSNALRTINVYSVKVPGKGFYMFLDEGKLNNFINKFLDVKQIYINPENNIEIAYKYLNLTFQNEKEIWEWSGRFLN